jgi:putative PIN family toxin of toxin-antitoxin system
MRVLIDTNVLISAAFRDRMPQDVILWIAAQNDWEWIVSNEILTEYKEVLQREKFGLPVDFINMWDQLIDRVTVSVDVNLSTKFPRDQKDAIFLAAALVCEADYFITGDHDFTEAQAMGNTIILSVSTFKKLIISNL